MEKYNYPVKLALRIDWSELDLFGHVNNVMFFKYIQASRVNYWRESGIIMQFEENRIGPMLASTNCQFKKQLHFPGNIIVEVRMEFIKNTSFGLQHRILDEAGEVAAEANDVIVMYDFNRNEKVIFPPELRTAVEKLEGRKL
jgi:acyl-CoA thioester hydrolase